MWGVLIEFVLLSLGVVGLAFAFLRLVGRTVGTPRRHLRLKEALPLGPNRLLALVEVAGRLYLVGVASSRIELLDEIPAEALAEEAEETVPESFPFPWRPRPAAARLTDLERRIARLFGPPPGGRSG